VRQAVGVENAAPALFSLPGGGKLLVRSPRSGETWIVDGDGAKRNLGSFGDAAWSPHGLYVVATRGDELVALDPQGRVHWTLARRHPVHPTWTGTFTDTRIAFQTADGLHVVAGDGTGDHVLDAGGRVVAPAWDPARRFALAYVSHGAIVLRQDTGATVWRRALSIRPTQLSWSTDGRYLAAVSPHRIDVLGAGGRLRRTVSMLGSVLARAAFAPRSHDLAVVVQHAGRSEVRVVDLDRPGHARLLFAGPGAFGDLAWSPNGDWLLVSWPAANQWVFIHGREVRAVANIRRQFPQPDHAASMPALAGRWCC
jgi:outer membrane protein assembly factor BamB